MKISVLHDVTIKLAQLSQTISAPDECIGRVIGLINTLNFPKFMNEMSIESNPSQPKESSVTKDIIKGAKEANEIKKGFIFFR